MAEASKGFHEPAELMSAETIDRHRAIVSLQEECEAVDWYDQRAEACEDPTLAEILGHNRDEEKEHAAMTLEWLRRRDPVWDEQLRTYLFTTGPIVDEDEDEDEDEGDHDDDADVTDPDRGDVTIDMAMGDLGIRSLHGGSNL